MAISTYTVCSICHEKFYWVRSNSNYSPPICSKCKSKEDGKKRLKYFKSIRKDKTLKQRIEAVEEWIYEHDNEVRINPSDMRF